MDNFEAIIRTLLEADYFWVQSSFKVELTLEEKLDLPRFGGRVVESIYSGVRMVLLCFTLGFSVPVFCITGTRSPVYRASGRSFSA